MVGELFANFLNIRTDFTMNKMLITAAIAVITSPNAYDLTSPSPGPAPRWNAITPIARKTLATQMYPQAWCQEDDRNSAPSSAKDTVFMTFLCSSRKTPAPSREQ